MVNFELGQVEIGPKKTFFHNFPFKLVVLVKIDKKQKALWSILVHDRVNKRESLDQNTWTWQQSEQSQETEIKNEKIVRNAKL